jgi:hypothetical protein
MPQPPIDLDPYKDKISTLFLNNTPIKAIAGHLQSQYNIIARPRTIERRLQQWGIRQRTVIDEAIRARIWELLRRSASSQRILQILQKEGTPISDRTLYSIRKEYGIQLRVDDLA